MPEIRVTHAGSDRFDVEIRGHRLVVDQPEEAGGSNAGPTPTELFVAGLVACVAHYANGFLARHAVDTDELQVVGEWEMAADRPARVGSVHLTVAAPSNLPASRRAALLAVVRHCTVHNSLDQPPKINVEIVDEPAASVAS